MRTPVIMDATLIVLAAATLTANATSNTFDLAMGNFLVAGQWGPSTATAPALQMVVPVKSYSTAAPGDQTYAFVVLSSADGTTWTPASRVGTVAGDAVPSTGGFIFLEFAADARYVRIQATLGGTSPSVTLDDCYVNPLVNRYGT